MGRYVLGIDGGGTKTVAVAGYPGQTAATGKGGAINLYSNTEDAVRENLRALAAGLLRQMGGADSCAAVAVGAAGLSHPQAARVLAEGLRAAGYTGPALLVSDMETALWGAIPLGVGATLLSGTGSLCYGRGADGRTARTGGGGHLIDDVGSGYDIGRRILARVLREWDSRAPASLLPALLKEKNGIESYARLMEFVYAPTANKRDIASLAPLLTAACERGDAAALAIARQAGEALAGLAVPVVQGLSLTTGRLALLGSILEKDAFVREAALEHVQGLFPALRVVQPEGNSADGALLLAQRLEQRPGFAPSSPFSRLVTAQETWERDT